MRKRAGVMNREGSELESIPALADGNPSDPREPPNGWCFGLSHTYIQRLIFLAGELNKKPALKPSRGSARPIARVNRLLANRFATKKRSCSRILQPEMQVEIRIDFFIFFGRNPLISLVSEK